jgi:hypothetical protein
MFLLSDWLEKLSPQERESMFKAIGYDRDSNLTGYPREVRMFFCFFLSYLFDKFI